eukprot:457422_1
MNIMRYAQRLMNANKDWLHPKRQKLCTKMRVRIQRTDPTGHYMDTEQEAYKEGSNKMNGDQTIRPSHTNQTSPYHHLRDKRIWNYCKSLDVKQQQRIVDITANIIKCSRGNTCIEEIVLDPDYSQPGITKPRVFH